MRNADDNNVTGTSLKNKHIAFVPFMLTHRLALEGRISGPAAPLQDDKKVVKQVIQRDYPHLKTVDWQIA